MDGPTIYVLVGYNRLRRDGSREFEMEFQEWEKLARELEKNKRGKVVFINNGEHPDLFTTPGKLKSMIAPQGEAHVYLISHGDPVDGFKWSNPGKASDTKYKTCLASMPANVTYVNFAGCTSGVIDQPNILAAAPPAAVVQPRVSRRYNNYPNGNIPKYLANSGDLTVATAIVATIANQDSQRIPGMIGVGGRAIYFDESLPKLASLANKNQQAFDNVLAELKPHINKNAGLTADSIATTLKSGNVPRLPSDDMKQVGHCLAALALYRFGQLGLPVWEEVSPEAEAQRKEQTGEEYRAYLMGWAAAFNGTETLGPAEISKAFAGEDNAKNREAAFKAFSGSEGKLDDIKIEVAAVMAGVEIDAEAFKKTVTHSTDAPKLQPNNKNVKPSDQKTPPTQQKSDSTEEAQPKKKTMEEYRAKLLRWAAGLSNTDTLGPVEINKAFGGDANAKNRELAVRAFSGPDGKLDDNKIEVAAVMAGIEIDAEAFKKILVPIVNRPAPQPLPKDEKQKPPDDPKTSSVDHEGAGNSGQRSRARIAFLDGQNPVPEKEVQVAARDESKVEDQALVSVTTKDPQMRALQRALSLKIGA